MRLHLDPALSGAGPAQTNQTGTSTPVSGTHPAGGVRGQDTGSRDSVSISGASAALGQLTSDRAARVGQLAAAVQGGSYRVSSAALSSAIVAQAAVSN